MRIMDYNNPGIDFNNQRASIQSLVAIYIRIIMYVYGNKTVTVWVVAFQCYRQRNHLHQHMLFHSGVKPHARKLCSKSYKSKLDLRYHYTRFHEVNVQQVIVKNRISYTIELPNAIEDEALPEGVVVIV